MQSLKSIFSIFLALTCAILAHSQYRERVVLPPLNESLPMTEIVRQAEAMPADTLKVRILIAIAHVYDRRGEVGNIDTSLIYLREAYTISTSIHDTIGTDEILKRLCQNYLWRSQLREAAALLKLAYGETRIRLELSIAEHFVNHQPVNTVYLERALPYLAEASRLADSMRSTLWQYEYLMVKAKYLFEHGEMENGKSTILAIIKNCVAIGDKKGEGNYWSEMNMYMPVTSQTAPYHIFACRNSIRAYQQAGDNHSAIYALRDLAVMHRFVCQYDSAEQEFQQFLHETEKLKITPSANTNYELAKLYLDKGDLAKALDYSLRSLNALGRLNNSFKRQVCGQLALIYQQTGNYDEELNFGQIAVEEAILFRASESHYFTTFVVDALVRMGKPEKALKYLQDFIAAHPAVSAEQQQAVAYNHGLIYDAQHSYQQADYWFRQLPALSIAAQHDINRSIFRHEQFNPFGIYLYTARFYVHWGKYQQARNFLYQALADPPLNRQSTAGSELEWLLYKTDSAAGDLRSAMKHYLLHSSIKDSIFNTGKMRQFQDLEVQYKTKQREQSILLLRSESERQRDQLHHASVNRVFELGGVIILLLLAGWAYYAYRGKRRNVQRLLEQQTEINDKNLTLEGLLEEKNELLTEKNLLLQEVHHRVKNNLHTVMSLLESQIAYLNDPVARGALLDSQNRIHTISLLHQKLYWSVGVTTLEMPPYIAELCAFLASSLGARERRISITQSIDPVDLDISVALPLGLLLNEAITNAIKHAFPFNKNPHAVRTGNVDVTMRKLADGRLLLQVADDGVGMKAPAEDGSHSLGLTLMTSIGHKLAADFSVQSSSGKGVLVALEFKITQAAVISAPSLS